MSIVITLLSSFIAHAQKLSALRWLLPQVTPVVLPRGYPLLYVRPIQSPCFSPHKTLVFCVIPAATAAGFQNVIVNISVSQYIPFVVGFVCPLAISVMYGQIIIRTWRRCMHGNCRRGADDKNAHVDAHLSILEGMTYHRRITSTRFPIHRRSVASLDLFDHVV